MNIDEQFPDLHPAISAFVSKQFQYPEITSYFKKGPRYLVNLREPNHKATAVFNLDGEWQETRYLISSEDIPVALAKSLNDNFHINSYPEVILIKQPFTDNLYSIIAQTQFSRLIIKGDESGWFMIDRVEDVQVKEVI